MKILAAGPSQNLTLSNSGEDRQPGVHLSDILKRMAYEKDKKYHPDDPIDMMTLECGFIWETILERSLSARHKRPGHRPEQLQEDGIWMSPDWVNPDADIQHEEWKATRKSLKSWEQKIDEWKPQAKAYVRALFRRRIIKRLATRFRVWFMVGDWSFESKGDTTLLRDYWDIDVEFDKRELEENWQSTLSAGRRYGLLKGEPREEAWPTKTRKKNDSNPPAKSHAKVLRGTFPTTKKSSRPRAES